jgi:hypothetical protein
MLEKLKQSPIREVENLFTLRDRSSVLDFLSAYPALANVLVETFFKIKEYFPTATLWLEVSTDPDEPYNTQLLVSVTTDLSTEEADTHLQQFDKDWWLDEMVHAQGKLCIILMKYGG